MITSSILDLSWMDFDKLIQCITKEILESGYHPDLIIGIERAGLIPAVYLSHTLEVRDFCSLAIKRTETDIAYSKKLPPIIGYVEHINARGKKVLIVDDVAQSGQTLYSAVDVLSKKGAKIISSAVLVNRNTSNNLKIDFEGMKANSWINFPWNKKT